MTYRPNPPNDTLLFRLSMVDGRAGELSLFPCLCLCLSLSLSPLLSGRLRDRLTGQGGREALGSFTCVSPSTSQPLTEGLGPQAKEQKREGYKGRPGKTPVLSLSLSLSVSCFPLLSLFFCLSKRTRSEAAMFMPHLNTLEVKKLAVTLSATSFVK